MTTQLVKIDPKEFGLEEQKAAQIEAQFKPMLEKMTELENEFNDVVKLPIEDKQTSIKAKELRLKYVKIRTGTADIHKQQKAFYLAGGRFCDGWKNAQEFASLGIEEKLMSIEKYAENMEKERILKLEEERKSLLLNLTDIMPVGLGTMDQSVFDNYLQGVKLAHAARIEAEKKAEEEIQAKIKAEIEEAERMLKENARLKLEAEAKEKQLLYERQQAQKQADKAEAERKKIAAENEAKLANERAIAAKKLQEQQAAAAKLQAELKAKQDAENARIEAEQQAEIKRKLEAEAKAAAPDKDKLIEYINSLSFSELDIKTAKGKAALSIITTKFEAFKVWAIQQTNSI